MLFPYSKAVVFLSPGPFKSRIYQIISHYNLYNDTKQECLRHPRIIMVCKFNFVSLVRLYFAKQFANNAQSLAIWYQVIELDGF